MSVKSIRDEFYMFKVKDLWVEAYALHRKSITLCGDESRAYKEYIENEFDKQSLALTFNGLKEIYSDISIVKRTKIVSTESFDEEIDINDLFRGDEK